MPFYAFAVVLLTFASVIGGVALAIYFLKQYNIEFEPLLLGKGVGSFLGLLALIFIKPSYLRYKRNLINKLSGFEKKKITYKFQDFEDYVTKIARFVLWSIVTVGGLIGAIGLLMLVAVLGNIHWLAELIVRALGGR